MSPKKTTPQTASHPHWIRRIHVKRHVFKQKWHLKRYQGSYSVIHTTNVLHTTKVLQTYYKPPKTFPRPSPDLRKRSPPALYCSLGRRHPAEGLVNNSRKNLKRRNSTCFFVFSRILWNFELRHLKTFETKKLKLNSLKCQEIFTISKISNFLIFPSVAKILLFS